MILYTIYSHKNLMIIHPVAL